MNIDPNVEKERSDKKIKQLYDQIPELQHLDVSELLKIEQHSNYLYNSLYDHSLHPYFDVQKPWLVYWIVNSLYVLAEDDNIEKKHRTQLANYILYFQDKKIGGFAGGLGYGPNLIATYAAILSLIALDNEESWKLIDKEKMEEFLLSCRSETTKGAYMAHELGEIDMRCTYAAVLIANLLNIDNKDIYDNVAEYVLSCQTYEGGIGPVPHMEAHGGYTFCGLAALALLDKLDILNIPKLFYWLINKQLDYKGGFCGRTNKLVDSCYSFWQAACFNILNNHLIAKSNSNSKLLYNNEMLQKYILLCCQGPKGGLKDKPTKNVDLYHTMYALCGMSLSLGKDVEDRIMFDWDSVELKEVDPVANVGVEQLKRFKEHFANLK